MECNLVWLLLVATTIHCVFATDKLWIYSSLYNDASNWQPPKLPCLNGKVELKDGAIFISNGSLPVEIVMSGDVEIVFGRNSEVNLGPPISGTKLPRETCEESVFRSKTRVWYNPENWLVLEKGVQSKQLTSAIPYIERVPCRGDGAVFPTHNAFSVKINAPVSVQSVTLKGNAMSNDNELQQYLSTKDGKENFMLDTNTRLNVSSLTCTKEGCMCGNYNMKSTICGSFTCPTLTCTKKVKPFQDCCFHCGALLEFEFDNGFVFDTCSTAVKSLVKNYPGKDVQVYMSRVTQNKIQMLFTDDQDGSDGEADMGVIEKAIKTPGHVCKPKPKTVIPKTHKDFATGDKGGSGTNTTTVTLAILLPLIIIVIIIVLIAIYRRRTGSGTIKRERFDDKDVQDYPGFANIDVATTDFMSPEYQASAENPAEGDKPWVIEVPRTKDAGHAFSNPTYNVVDLDPDDEDFSKSVLDIGLSNPLYEARAKEREEKEQQEIQPQEEKVKVDPDMPVNNGEALPVYQTIEKRPPFSTASGEKNDYVALNVGTGVSNPLYDEIKAEMENKEPQSGNQQVENVPPLSEDTPKNDSVAPDMGLSNPLYDEVKAEMEKNESEA